jgi:hypothetical protein
MAGDVNFVVDFETSKAERGIDKLRVTIARLGDRIKKSLSVDVMLGNLAAQAVSNIVGTVKDMAKEVYRANLSIEERIFQTQRALGDMSKSGSKLIQVAIEDLAKTSGRKIEDVAATFQVLSDAEGMTLEKTKAIATEGYSLARILGLAGEQAGEAGMAIDSLMKGFNEKSVAQAKALSYHLKTVADLDFSSQVQFIERMKGIKISGGDLAGLFTFAKQQGKGSTQVKALLNDFSGLMQDQKVGRRAKVAAGGGIQSIMQFMATNGSDSSKGFAQDWMSKGGANVGRMASPEALAGIEESARELMTVRQQISEAAVANATAFAGTSAVVMSNQAIVASNYKLAESIDKLTGRMAERRTYRENGEVMTEKNTMFDRPIPSKQIKDRDLGVSLGVEAWFANKLMSAFAK